MSYSPKSNVHDASGNNITSTSNALDVNVKNASVAVTVSGSVPVTGSLTDTQLRASAVPVSAASLPLPSGAATSALQSTINTTLGSPFQAGGSIGNTAFGISGTLPAYASTPTFNLGTLNGVALDSSVTSLSGKFGSLGQKAMSGSAPVVISSDQSALPVTGTFYQATQPVSATQLPSALGQTTMSASLPVTIASNQTGSKNHTDTSDISHSLTGGQNFSVSCNGASTLAFAVTGSWVGTISIDGTLDGSTYTPMTYVDLIAFGTGGGSVTNSATPSNIFYVPCAGMSSIRFSAGGGNTGTAVVSVNASSAAGIYIGNAGFDWVKVSGSVTTTNAALALAQASTTSGQTGPLVQTATTTAAPTYVTAKTNPLSTTTGGGLRVDLASVVGTAMTTGTGASGAGIPRVTISNDSSLAANQSVNVAQINGVTPLMGNGTTGTGSHRVTPASDATINTNTYSTRTDTFTTTANGTTVDVSLKPMKYFSLQCKATGAVTSWTIVLEGSLDNSNFDTLVTHTNVTPGDGKISLTYALATLPIPMRYFRSRCSAITLGGGTNVIASILGMT